MSDSFRKDLKELKEIGKSILKYSSGLVPVLTECRLYRHMRRYNTSRKDCLTFFVSSLIYRTTSLSLYPSNPSLGTVLYIPVSLVEGAILDFHPKSI